MLKESMEAKLNDQLNKEVYSAYLYFSMAAYFESVSLKGFASWMKVQAQEELTHADKLFDYINDRNGRVQLCPVEGPPSDWDSPIAVMQNAYEHECWVSEKINECVTLALAENDHPTNTFLQWFVAEQVEEEATADEIVQKLKLIGDNSSGLFLIDNEVGGRSLDSGDGAGGA